MQKTINLKLLKSSKSLTNFKFNSLITKNLTKNFHSCIFLPNFQKVDKSKTEFHQKLYLNACKNTLKFYSTSTSTSTDIFESEAIYSDYVDEELEHLQSVLITALETNLDEFDCELSYGVLTIKIGLENKSIVSFVVNKQTPNRQIWLSSPISGPKRFFFDFEKKQWVNNRTSEPLRQLLKQEFLQLTNIEINF
eukprot:TRINITY_DN7143_c3_g1_i1.p1 TRINITY_DN7143_c3_g1~~TRINITY_DN7143_c3_g1_i1.p1  ORF type:complete len:194 (-),score=53.58 TRINITY_DN7143_c3_g1_i1:48-629(-)